MLTFLTVIHVFAAVLLIIIVLIQGGKGSEIGAAFGGGSQTVFGSSGGVTFFTKITTAMAVVFMVTSIALAKLSVTRSSKSVVPTKVEDVQKEPEKEAKPMTEEPPPVESAPATK